VRHEVMMYKLRRQNADDSHVVGVRELPVTRA
jgi:hypothetical protein